MNPTSAREVSVNVLADSRGSPRLNGSVRSAVVDLKKSMTFWFVENTTGADVRLKAVTKPKESVNVAEDSLGNPRPNELVIVAVDSLGMLTPNWTVESAVAVESPKLQSVLPASGQTTLSGPAVGVSAIRWPMPTPAVSAVAVLVPVVLGSVANACPPYDPYIDRTFAPGLAL